MNVSELLAIPSIQLTDGTYQANSILISDTTVNLSSNAPAILALRSLVSRIFVTEVLTVAHALSLTSLLPLINDRTIHDSAANVLSHAIELGSLGTNISIRISDTPANVLSHASAILGLGKLVSTISVADGWGVTVAYALSLTSLLPLTETLIISDTTANLVANASAILAMGTLAQINVIDGLTVANALSLKVLSSHFFIPISDTATNVISHANELKALGANINVYIYDTAANVIRVYSETITY